jgi:hypothetical protein
MEKILGPVAEPELKDVLDKYSRLTLSAINCVQIGTIEIFNPATCTASVSINCKRKLTNGEVYDYPLLTDCPVFILSGGTAFIGMPILKGDTCIMLFNDRDIDNWYLTGAVDVPSSTRMHALSDGICLVGVRPLTNPLALEAGKVSINAGTNLVQIKNTVTSMLTVLNALVDQIALITVTPAMLAVPTPVPNNAAAILAIKVQLALLLGT